MQKYLLMVLLLLAISGLSLFSYGKWREANYFGKVLSVDATHITISDHKEGSRDFVIDGETKIFNKEHTEVVTTENTVVIIAEKGSNGAPIARVIRVMDHK